MIKAGANATGNRSHRRNSWTPWAGIALLLADKLSAEQRKAIGWTLVGVGALTTIPLAVEVFNKRH